MSPSGRKTEGWPISQHPGSDCTAADRPPLVITYHPKNIAVCNILLRNYTILRDDDSTKVTFDKPPLKAFRRAKNLKDRLVHSSLPQVLQRQIGTFPRNRRDCSNSSDCITTTQGQIKISEFFYVHHQPAGLLYFVPQMPWGCLRRRDSP